MNDIKIYGLYLQGTEDLVLGVRDEGNKTISNIRGADTSYPTIVTYAFRSEIKCIRLSSSELKGGVSFFGQNQKEYCSPALSS